jgi:hypothetical protein
MDGGWQYTITLSKTVLLINIVKIRLFEMKHWYIFECKFTNYGKKLLQPL